MSTMLNRSMALAACALIGCSGPGLTAKNRVCEVEEAVAVEDGGKTYTYEESTPILVDVRIRQLEDDCATTVSSPRIGTLPGRPFSVTMDSSSDRRLEGVVVATKLEIVKGEDGLSRLVGSTVVRRDDEVVQTVAVDEAFETYGEVARHVVALTDDVSQELVFYLGAYSKGS